ncbi:hypothetical protein [Fodinibius sp. Rm-B-1B1-1]|uniref:hypothetical protein n=1 Tax=Fodinibius alkaliphilus TaxID=3140241 RepID=UPI003159E405
MKSFTHKLLAIIFSVALFTGCASITDSGIDQQPEQPTPTIENPDFGSESTMDPIVDRPE